MRAPLWLKVELHGSTATVELAKCRNCGKTKASSDPCGFDHLAAVMEFKAFLETYVTAPEACAKYGGVRPDTCIYCERPYDEHVTRVTPPAVGGAS